jgi:transcription factor TFIIIB component B''
LGIGKKFKHADLILERQRQARQEAKQRRLDRQKGAMGLLPEEDTQDGSRAGTPAAGEGDNTASGIQGNRGQGIDFDIIDGQIMINQNSLVINQHAVEANIHLETVEEDEFTHLTTSASYMRPSKALGPNHWDDEDTEKFYKYLKMFGTDFETISHMFPGRNRRQVKLKFNREEKQRPNRVNAAIMAKGEKRVAIDIEEYKNNRSGFNDPWITPDKFQAEQEQLRQEQEKELEAKRQERRDLGLLEDEKGPGKKPGASDNKENAEEEEEELLIDDQDVGGTSVPIAAM